MTPPATPTKSTRNCKPKPKSPHLSRAERRVEKNTRKQIIKKEAAKHRSREDKRCKKNLVKKASNRARKALKAKSRKNQQAGCVAEAVNGTTVKELSRQYGTVSRASSIFNPSPKTAKAIANAVRCDSPSFYSHELGAPLFPTLSQGGVCKVERNLTQDFLRVRKTVEKGGSALPSRPDDATDFSQGDGNEWIGNTHEMDDQGSEYDFAGPVTVQHGAWLEFFGNPEEKTKPHLMTPDSCSADDAAHGHSPNDCNKVKARTEAKWIRREGDPHHIAFDEQGRPLRALSYFDDLDSNESEPGDGHNHVWDNIDFRATAPDGEDEDNHEVTVLRHDENDRDVEEIPYIDLTQDDTTLGETDDEDELHEVDSPTGGIASDSVMDLTQDLEDMEGTPGNGSNQESVVRAHVPTPRRSRVVDLTGEEDYMNETEDDENSDEIAAPMVETAPNQDDDVMNMTDASALTPTAAEPVEGATGSSSSNPEVIDDSEEAHEAKLELNLKKELRRTQERRKAETREASRLEQLLALDHFSLMLLDLSGEDADVRDSFQFIQAMRAEECDLNAKASVLEKEFKSLMDRDPVSFEDRRKAERIGKLWHANEKATTHLVNSENLFRDRASRHQQCYMREMLNAMKKQLLQMFENYDNFLKEQATLEVEMGA